MTSAPPDRPIVLASNRGPVSFRRDDGRLVSRRGAGGLISGIGPLMSEVHATWLASAISDGDREAAAGGVVDADGFRVHPDLLDGALTADAARGARVEVALARVA